MAIKIKKNGKVENFILHSTDIRVVDVADKFKKKDLESVIDEISDTEHIHVGEVDISKDGIWIDDGAILDSAEDNGVISRLKTYFSEQIGDKAKLITTVKDNIVSAINENRQEIIKRNELHDGNWFTANGIDDLDVVHHNVQVYTTGASVTKGLPNGLGGGGGFFKCEITYASGGRMQNAVQTYVHTSTGRKFTRSKNNAGGVDPNTLQWTSWVEITNNSNPNILINGDFKVWQRGTSFTLSSPGYCADRWFNFNTKGVYKKTDYGIECTSDSWNHVSCSQKISMDEIDLRGCTLTYSVKLHHIGTNSTFTLAPYSYDSAGTLTTIKVDTYTTISDGDIISVTFNVPTNAKYIMVNTYASDKTASKTNKANFGMYWAKLELGSMATPFIAKQYSEELAMCHRYYQKLPIPQTPRVADPNQFNVELNMLSPTRVNPTLSWGSVAYLHSADTTNTVIKLCSNVEAPEVIISSGSSVTYMYGLLIVVSNTTITGGTSWTINNSPSAANRLSGISYILVDAEIY